VNRDLIDILGVLSETDEGRVASQTDQQQEQKFDLAHERQRSMGKAQNYHEGSLPARIPPSSENGPASRRRLTNAASRKRRGHEEDDHSHGEGGDDAGDDNNDEENAGPRNGGDQNGDSGGGPGVPESTIPKSNKDDTVPASSSSSKNPAGDRSKVQSSCSGIPCRLGSAIGSHVIVSTLILVAVALLCYWRLKVCCSSRRRADQGEYRMVAAQYVDSAFDDSLSDPGDEDGSDDDVDGGWSKRGKKSIEMHAIDRETNGGLTLEEMNG
jgi:hypothetical protein